MMRKISVLCGLQIVAAAIVTAAPTPSAAQSQSGVTGQILCSRSLNPHAGFQNTRENCDNNGVFATDLSRVNGGQLYQAGDILSSSLSTNGNSLDTYAANAVVRANIGALGVAASTSLTGLESSSTDALASASWYDTLFVDAPRLADFTPIRVRLTQIVDIHDLYFDNAGTNGTAYVNLDHFFSAQQFGGGNVDVFNSHECALSKVGPLASGACAPFGAGQLFNIGRNTFTYEFDVRANRDLYLSESLGLSTGVYNFVGGLISGQSGLDALNTAHTYLTVLTPGATLISQSGHDYALPSVAGVPEPASWAMMIAGFGLVGGALRNSAKRRREAGARRKFV